VTPAEQDDWYERVHAEKEARRRQVLNEVIANHRQRTGLYNVADRTFGQSHEALLRNRDGAA